MTYPAPNVSPTIEELSKIHGAMEDELAVCRSLFLDDSDPKQLAREREGCRTNIGMSAHFRGLGRGQMAWPCKPERTSSKYSPLTLSSENPGRLFMEI